MASSKAYRFLKNQRVGSFHVKWRSSKPRVCSFHTFVVISVCSFHTSVLSTRVSAFFVRWAAPASPTFPHYLFVCLLVSLPLSLFSSFPQTRACLYPQLPTLLWWWSIVNKSPPPPPLPPGRETGGRGFDAHLHDSAVAIKTCTK
jgi:hypothetical protein